MVFIRFIVCTIIIFILASCLNPEQIPGKPWHHTTEGFRNPPGSPEKKSLKAELEKLSCINDGQLQIQPIPNQTDTGPTSKITHRIVLSGDDQKGLLNKIIKTLDENNALIVRMNTEKISFPTNTQYISRFAISVREENAPECLSQIVKVAGEMKLTFRYETS